MVKNGITKPVDMRTKEKVLELESKGYTRKQIQEFTGVSRITQQRISRKNSLGVSIESKISKRNMYNNPNSKYTEEYCEKLKLFVKEKDDLTNDEYIKEMEEKTGIKLSESSMSRLMRKLNITAKKKQPFMKIHSFQ
jgi:transposase